MEYMTTYIKNGTFPTKSNWKRIMSRALHTYYTEAWRARLHADDEFNPFRAIHLTVSPSAIWTSARSRSEIIHAISAIHALTYRHFQQAYTCKLCNTVTANIIDHILVVCNHTYLRTQRESFIDDLYTLCGQQVSSFIQGCINSLFTYLFQSEFLVALGCTTSCQKIFMNRSCKFVHDSLSIYRRH